MTSAKTLSLALAIFMLTDTPEAIGGVVPAVLSRQDAGEIDGVAKRFTENLVAGDPKAVVAVFVDASPLMAGKTAEISNLEGQVATALKIYGKVSSVELVSEKTLGTMVVRRYYLARHKNLVTRWELNFAHSTDGWTMTYFAFDDQQRTWFVD